jgi:hypothetical protein
MAGSEFQWHPRPPNVWERIGAGVFLALMVLVVGSQYCGWHLFAGREKQVGAGLVLIGLVLLRCCPTVRHRYKPHE